MLYYDRLEFSKGIDVIKTNESKECDMCHYRYFLKRFKFQSYICNRYHDLLMISMNLGVIVILKVKNAEYCCIISRTSKSEGISLMQSLNLAEKFGTLQKFIKNKYQKEFLKL